MCNSEHSPLSLISSPKQLFVTTTASVLHSYITTVMTTVRQGHKHPYDVNNDNSEKYIYVECQAK